MKRLLVVLIILLILPACSMTQDRPTEERMDRWFSKPRYVIQLESAKSPTDLIDGLRRSDCQGGQVTSTTIQPAGPNVFVPVSATVHFRAVFGFGEDGMEWGSLNSDSRFLHDSVMAVRAFPRGQGSKVLVTPVRRGIDDEILASLEAGTLFCNWRDFVDQWRM